MSTDRESTANVAQNAVVIRDKPTRLLGAANLLLRGTCVSMALNSEDPSELCVHIIINVFNVVLPSSRVTHHTAGTLYNLAPF